VLLLTSSREFSDAKTAFAARRLGETGNRSEMVAENQKMSHGRFDLLAGADGAGDRRVERPGNVP
jgi:hypothetical protein